MGLTVDSAANITLNKSANADMDSIYQMTRLSDRTHLGAGLRLGRPHLPSLLRSIILLNISSRHLPFNDWLTLLLRKVAKNTSVVLMIQGFDGR